MISEFYARIGEDLLVLFPETIPFLAELLQDDDETVETKCKQVCLQIQDILGESIDHYFKA